MKNLELVGLVALDAAELEQVQGGVSGNDGGCIPPLFPKPLPPYDPLPPYNPFPPDDHPFLL